MVTYADMLTLLLVLFIVLYAMGQVNTSKFNQLKSSLASAFNGHPSILSGGAGINSGDETVKASSPLIPSIPAIKVQQTKNGAGPSPAQLEVDQFTKIEQSIKNALHQRHLDGAAEFSIDERGLVVTIITNELVFTGNSAVLQPEGKTILQAVMPPLLKIDNQIQVDGHTNQLDVSTDPYPSGWELSSARASSVVRYLVAGGMDASRLSAVGFSGEKPLIPPSNPLSVTRNRRVDVVVLSKLPAGDRSQLTQLGQAAADG
jgi:chemotaxis protein MotB